MVLQGSMTRILFSILHSKKFLQYISDVLQRHLDCKMQSKFFQIYTISIDDHWSFSFESPYFV